MGRHRRRMHRRYGRHGRRGYGVNSAIATMPAFVIAPSPDPHIIRVAFKRNGLMRKQPSTGLLEQYISSTEWRAWIRDGNAILSPAAPTFGHCTQLIFWIVASFALSWMFAGLLATGDPMYAAGFSGVIVLAMMPCCIYSCAYETYGSPPGMNYNAEKRAELWTAFEMLTKGLFEPRGITLYMDSRLPYMDIRLPGTSVDPQMAAATAFLSGAQYFPVPFVPDVPRAASMPTYSDNLSGHPSAYATEAPPSYSQALLSPVYEPSAPVLVDEPRAQVGNSGDFDERESKVERL